MSKGYEKLKESVERDCARYGGELHTDGCTDSCNGKCFHKYCNKFKWAIDRAKVYGEAFGLKSYAAYMGSVVSRIKNEETEQKFDEAIQNLLDFEKEHGINIDSSCSCS